MLCLRVAKFFVPLSVLLVLTSIVLVFYPGPKLSIEFSGGTLMELALPEGKQKQDLEGALAAFRMVDEKPLESLTVTATQEGTAIIRMQDISNEEHQRLLDHLGSALGGVKEAQYTTIGPTVGTHLKRRSLYALATATVAIILYIAFAFRKIPPSLSPWSYGVAAIVALIHDVLITVGIFTILSYFTTFQVDTLFVTALLSIMGYSVNDTIVIFDRIRDNLILEGRVRDFPLLVEQSLRQSLSRTLNTGLGAFIMLFALYFLGSPSIQWFILTLIVGTLIGTYSSFFVATPWVVYWGRRR